MSIWFLEQRDVVNHPDLGSASPEVTKKVCYDETKNENEERNTGYPPINEAILLEMIAFMRDQQFYKSEAVKDHNIFKKEVVPRNLIPLQKRCHLCNATLSNPIKVSENVIVVTFQGAFKDYISYVKQCLFCKHFYRYQACIHGIHNYDDRFFMGIDVCLFLREHVQNHSSVSSFVKSYNTLFNCTLVHQSNLNGYLPFDLLCEAEREFYCYVSGYHPSALIMDLNRKIAFKMTSEEFEETNIDKNYIEPDLNLTLNTEHLKVKKGTDKNIENDECREMTEKRLLEMLSNDALRKVKSAAKTCKVSAVGSKIDIRMRIKAAALKDGKRFRKTFSKIWGHFGGWLSFSCPHGVVCYLKFLLPSESSRDYVGCLWNIYLISRSSI